MTARLQRPALSLAAFLALLGISECPCETDADLDGYTICEGDCDDSQASISPGAQEVCNSLDDNCDGVIDEGFPTTWHPDADMDGYGDGSITITSCTPPEGTVADGTDCNDQSSSVWPSAPEWADDGIDQDCNGEDLTLDPNWTCTSSWYGGLYCDCGCQVLDPMCADATVESCAYNNCPDGFWPDAAANYQCHPIACGNGQLEDDEVCDDGNLLNGDGCSSGCRLEFAPGETFRVMTANLSSGTGYSYDPGEGIRIFQGLKPQVVLIQEFNYGSNSQADLREFVDLAFGPTYSFHRDSGDNIPCGVISAFPILEAGTFDDPLTTDREFSWARIDLPGSRELFAVSVHFLTSSSSERQAEANALVDYLAASVSANDYVVIGGDLNTASSGEQCLSVLRAWVSTSITPVDGNGNRNTNSTRSKPYDWVLPDPDLEALHAPVMIGSSYYSTGLVFDSRVYEPLGEVSPVLEGDSGASGMQHMGVVKDFRTPTP